MRPDLACRRAALGFALAGLFFAGAASASAGELGANKYDLVLQYLLPPPDGKNDAGYRRVRRAMAEKAIADARDAGLRFLRASVTGYFPVNFGDRQDDLTLWQQDPAAYWAILDEVFDDLDRAGIGLIPSFLWQRSQFPVLGDDTIATFVSDPGSRSRALLTRYLGEFIPRYQRRKTILFYELTNEMNLDADLDLTGKCPKDRPGRCVWDHFSTEQMRRFAQEVVGEIKKLDPSRPVSSGYSLPRPAAAHLALHPDFARHGDWAPDSREQFQQYLSSVNAPFDIISAHVYPGPDVARFGRAPDDSFGVVDDVSAVARSLRKRLFIGEFGDARGASPFMTQLFDAIVRDRVDYAAVWTWEYYQSATYRTHDTEPSRSSIEPGYFDDVLALMLQTERRLGYAPPPRPPDAPPRIVLVWPLPCASVAQPTELVAVASDGARPVSRVDFLIGAKQIGTSDAPPYAVRFDPAGFATATADITGQAIGKTGRTAAFTSRVRLREEAPCTTSP